MGAMPAEETENCRESLESLERAVGARKGPEARSIFVKDSLNDAEIPLLYDNGASEEVDPVFDIESVQSAKG